jgi:hypothetical protein
MKKIKGVAGLCPSFNLQGTVLNRSLRTLSRLPVQIGAFNLMLKSSMYWMSEMAIQSAKKN